MIRGTRTVLLLASFLALTACRSRKNPEPSAPITAPSPLPRLVANDGAIALGNLGAQISSLEKRSEQRSARISLVELLLSRGQFLGRIADYERAAALADALVAEAPKDPSGYEARASTRSTFHRFDAALADLAEAERLGSSAAKLAPARASVFEATGRYDEAAALVHTAPQDEAHLGVLELARKGLLAGEMGNDAEAERLLALARDRYPDVSPFPLAWIDAQQASLLERHGKPGRARLHYARAVALLPLYAKAASHLATLSPPAEAVALLEPVAASSDDPEVLVQLADALRRSGRREDAERRLADAKTRYDDLLSRHPEAFADHAASMWLFAGGDPARALTLARQNVEVRRTPEAYDLFLTAALAAHAEGDACTAARGALGLRYVTDGVRAMAAPIAARCPPLVMR